MPRINDRNPPWLSLGHGGHSIPYRNVGVMLRALCDFLESLVRWALCWSYFMCWALSALLYLGILGLLLLKWLAY